MTDNTQDTEDLSKYEAYVPVGITIDHGTKNIEIIIGDIQGDYQPCKTRIYQESQAAEPGIDFILLQMYPLIPTEQTTKEFQQLLTNNLVPPELHNMLTTNLWKKLLELTTKTN